MNILFESELILNQNGSVYHLGLRPEHIANDIITVGDPDRVEAVSKYFDKVTYVNQVREFKTACGELNGKFLTVISTGIGTDNVDIVLNEIDFLVNYNLETRTKNEVKKAINIYRVGTSGSISKEVELDSVVYSNAAISFERLFDFYKHNFESISFDNKHYSVIPCSSKLKTIFSRYSSSLTLTASGFYGPQFRNSGLTPKYDLTQIQQIAYDGNTVGNIEMETAGLYGLSALLGFECISLNAILADRITGKFSSKPAQVVDNLIKEALQIIC